MSSRPFIIIIAALSTCAVVSCDQITARKAVDLNDSVIAHQQRLITAVESFYQDLDERKDTEIAAGLKDLRTAVGEGKAGLKKKAALDCDPYFLRAAQSMYDTYDALTSGPYSVIASLLSMDSLSYEEYDSLQVIMQEAEQSQQKADADFLEAQQSFSRSCGFKLVRYAD